MKAPITREPSRASIRRKGSGAKKVASRVARKVVPVYPADYPVDYVAQQPYPIEVKPGSGTTVVLLPAGRDNQGRQRRMILRIALVVNDTAGPVTITPRGLGMMLVHVPPGKPSTP